MKAATVSVIGRPSAGKSTIVNTITGMKVSITSPTPQTTRNKIRGIYTDQRGQLVFTDTPGYHLSDKEINKRMQDVTVSSLSDSDMILYMLDGTRTPGKEEETIAELVKQSGVPVVAVVNKADILSAEKAEEEEYEIAGFLAYDITFVDPDGNETEPNGEVKVSINYKEAAIPESVSEEDAQNAEVTVLHLEEDEKGEVKEVVDMAQTEKVDVLATTEENKVEKAEVKTESFSTFVIQWGNRRNQVTVHYVDESGTEIQGTQKTTVTKEIATGVTL